MTAVYFEDITLDVERQLGSYHVSKDEVIAFAKEWDPQPFHTNEQAAKESIYGGLTGSSIHMMAGLSKVISRNPVHYAVLANLSTQFSMPNPMRVGDTLYFSSHAYEKRLSKSRPGIGIVSFKTLVINQNNQTVLDTTTTTMVSCRQANNSLDSD